MTDRTQFEAMLEALINEDQETAKEIFHNIVVAKSREIYEELLESDFNEESEEEEEESVEEGENPFASAEEEEGEEEEGEEEEGEEEESGDDVGGDATDDFIGDIDGEEGDEEGGEGELEDRVMDLEDALDELKAEFEELMADEENEPEHNDGVEDPDFAAVGGDEVGGDEVGGEEEFDELAGLMEYVNKISPPKHGDNGANTKSPLAGKNDMGGTTANIVKGGTSTTGGTQGGLLKPTTQEENFGNVNVPGNSKAPKLSNVANGHGAEKKGKSETADKSAGSPINGVKSRAK